MKVIRQVHRALAVAALAASLVACSDSSDDEPESAAPTCSGAAADVVNSGGPYFAFEPVGRGGPHLDRAIRVSSRPKAGYLCADIAIDHADTGAETTGYTLVARKAGTTWEQDGMDPDDQSPLRIDARGCVDFTATLTVIGAGEEEFDYRARGRTGIDCSS